MKWRTDDPFGNYVPPPEVDQVEPAEDPRTEAAETLGFHPDLLINIAGTTFKTPEGIPRQDYIRMALGLMDRYKTIPVRVRPEPENEYDTDAVGVYLPTGDKPTGELTNFRHVGYVPRRVCWNCFTGLSGKQAKLDLCPTCRTPTDDEQSSINGYISRRMLEKGVVAVDSTDEQTQKQLDMQLGLVWISRGKSGRTIGVRLGFKFN